MVHSDFVHLHVHTEYSLLDGACPVLDGKGKAGTLIQKALKHKLPALAITDHGSMFGAIEFYSACMKEGIKPIIGCEMYVAFGNRREKGGVHARKPYHHLVLLAKDDEGYRNLMKLVSIGYLEGFYYKPRIDREVLAQYSKGLLATSACIKGEIPWAIIDGDMQKAREALAFYKDVFGEDFYLELMDNGIKEQKQACEGLIKLGRETNTSLVATNDCHYVNREDAYAQEILMCIGTGKTIDDPSHLKLSTQEFYLKSPQEMKNIFKDVPDAIHNTIEITEKCNLEIEFGRALLPNYKVPEKYELNEYLGEICEKGIKKRYKKVTPQVRERLAHELDVIKKMGYPGYFLIVWDFIDYAKKNGVPVGPGRGSGAGSLVAYLLGITELDPIEHGLLFERFLNIERKNMPDLDIDFADTGRDKVIDYVRKKYGEENVAQIITFGTLQARAVIRDTGRVLNVPLSKVDRVAKLVPFGDTIQEALKAAKELKQLYDTDKSIKELLDTARKLEGLKRHSGVHAAGIVIAPGPITDYTPFAMTSKEVATSQYEGKSLEKLGLLKVDFLGLRTLSLIDGTIKLINENYRLDLKPGTIPLDDKKTYEMLSEAKSVGVFQLESAGMRDLLRKLKPTEFSDIVAVNALYRPGPLGSGMVDDFIERKHGKKSIEYDHKTLEPVLKDTYGVILYQEQVMRIATDMAGFSLGQADILRAAMGKKKFDVLEEQRKTFIEGAVKNKIDKKTSNDVFNKMVQFGGYGFNKSHAAAYGLLAYQTAYLKCNYPNEFMATVLNTEKEDTDKVAQYIAECSAMDILIKPPNINHSKKMFSIEGDGIRYGFSAIKNVGSSAAEFIEREREEAGEFDSFQDFCLRINSQEVNKRVVENLVKAGAFDFFDSTRAALFSIIDEVLARGEKMQKDKRAGQTSFFEMITAPGDEQEIRVPELKEWSDDKMLAFEKEAIGFYLSGHPLARYEKEMNSYTHSPINRVLEEGGQGSLMLGGIIIHLKRKKTRTGKVMAVFKLEDLTGAIEVIIFPDTYQKLLQFVEEDEMVVIKGNVDERDNTPKIIAEDVIPFSAARERLVKRLSLKLSTAGLENDTLKELEKLFRRHEGKCKVSFKLRTLHHGYVSVSTQYSIQLNDNLMYRLEELVGQDSIKLST